MPGTSFQTMAAFGAGGIFLTTGSDQAGTGIGQWSAPSAGAFAFSYKNFHFGTDGKLSSITTVNATGTFAGSSMQGSATQSEAAPDGSVLMPAQAATFTGSRFVVTAP